jgi:hypothetical protein
MSPTFTYDQLNSDQSQVTTDGLRNVGNAAADLVCGLWQNYSEWTSGFSDPTGIGQINNALFSKLCKPRGKEPPAPPALNFTGGQCAKAYSVAVNVSYGPIPNVANTTIFNVTGPIRGFAPGGSPPSGQISLGIQAAPTVLRPDGFYPIVTGTKNNVLPYTVNSFVPTPQSGADNCGDPPKAYPPKTPPASEVQKNISVNIGAGVVVPVVATYVPVSVNANVAINPQFQANIGPFNVTFDAGGVTIAPNFQFGTGGSTLPNPSSYPITNYDPVTQNNGTSNCDLSPVTSRLDSQATQLTAIKTELDDVKDCSCPRTYTVGTVALGTGICGYVALPSNCIKVSLSLTQIPLNAKTQKSNGSEPVKYFCGYYYWGDGTGRTERVAVSVAQSVFFPPVWATSFGWDLYLGYNSTVTATVLNPTKSDSELAVRQMKKTPV